METKSWQRVEGALILVAGLVVFAVLDPGIAWWLAFVIFFLPDVSFAAYLAGPRIGAAAYNLVHIYAAGAVLLALGLWVDAAALAGTGALWLAHSGFDRMLGYGLKEPTGFQDTHLGRIGR